MAEQLSTPEEIRARIREIYRGNPFMSDYFGISIDEIHCGGATVSLLTVPEKHTNHRGVIHGGVMAALADSVTGVTGASMGRMVVTVSLTLDYIRNCRPGSRIRVTSHVLHCGRTTMCIGAEMYDEEDRLMANLLASMMVVGSFPEIPEQW
jgi:putative thioesterase domain protein